MKQLFSPHPSSFILHPFLLKAKKSRWFETVFAAYNRNLLRRRFTALRVAGIENLIARDKSLPLVLYANHSSWWDGLVAFEIGRASDLDQFVMMEESELKRLFLFRRLGAFSVNKRKPRDILASLNYAAQILNEKENRALWIFPQGEILPNDARPLTFYGGLARVVEKTKKCFAAPVAMRYEFLGEFKPHAFARVGKLQLCENVNDSKSLIENFAETLTSELEWLKTDVVSNNLSDYEKLPVKKNARRSERFFD